MNYNYISKKVQQQFMKEEDSYKPDLEQINNQKRTKSHSNKYTDWESFQMELENSHFLERTKNSCCLRVNKKTAIP